ncbi:hypothetical protein F5141DRAFT_1011488 [Pisolithus sp. B1]|nr:hypothetical protein F5141DRAFT_1011488 [Pisolithus sp. B1]
MIKQFDIPKNQEVEVLGAELAEGNDGNYDVISTDLKEDDTEGWVNEVSLMTAEEQAGLEHKIHPVQLALAKVCKLAFKIIHSTTIVLPTWDTACKEAGMGMRQIPWDVSTCWNSTFDMVSFIVEYRTPVEALTDKCCLSLAAYALDKHEWLVLGQLCEVLKVSHGYCTVQFLHPHHKLEYFRQAKWEANWIKTAGELIHCNYDSSYASCDIHEDVGSPSSDGDECKVRFFMMSIFNLLCILMLI